jgi:hypothetical protein
LVEELEYTMVSVARKQWKWHRGPRAVMKTVVWSSGNGVLAVALLIAGYAPH